MSVANLPTSDSYYDYLISRLKNPIEAAAYIEAILEEEDPEPTLLKSALLDVIEAFSRTELSLEQAEVQRQKLDHVLSLSGSQAIYGLMTWLDDLGLKLSVSIQDQDSDNPDD
ncbi:MAG: transcriptional regulator [Oscillatoriales cyanobacterium C42_A2020_001]|nr:transcriptional regulator [Leptolyngbyaceae cyanobacterium C42_A2020_001]